MKHLFILFALCACMCAYAQDKPKGPDLQTIDDGFFDPTKEEKVKEDYHFGVEYRLEVGYVQNQQRTKNKTYPDMYLHGARVGATFTFLLPQHFSMETGLLYSVAANKNDQHYAMAETTDMKQFVSNTIVEHNLVVPVRAFYVIPLWKQLNLFFYAGPQLQIGLAQTDKVKPNLSDQALIEYEKLGVPLTDYDKYASELVRANIQMGLGGGFEWDKYRLQAGYDFGLNNMVRTKLISNQHMWEWGWYVSFLYKL